jgi:cytosine/adenosine deaminase-related metal-dependent hydrolase
MKSAMNRLSGTLRAEWIVPVDGPPVRNGVITIKDGVIKSLMGNAPSRPNEIELGQVVLFPGLINAHTHLEFSDLKQPLGYPGIPFTDWILLVVQQRMLQTNQPGEADAKFQSIEHGFAESRHAGVSHLGEIATGSLNSAAYTRQESPCATVFLELLGRDDRQLEQKLSDVRSGLDRLRLSSSLPGISPHASYSVSPRLLDRTIELASNRELPVAMHLAESKAELELLRNLDGPFVPLLQRLGAWFPESYSKHTRPLDYLQKLSRLSQVLIVHGNYLAGDELEFISQHKSRFSIAYCPRTHQFFGHDPYPLGQMLRLGINVALGTDSRASNPDLNLLKEMKTVRESFPDIGLDQIVEMATLGGAKALGLQRQLGSLTTGKQAVFCVAPLNDKSLDDPYAGIVNADDARLYDFMHA